MLRQFVTAAVTLLAASLPLGADLASARSGGAGGHAIGFGSIHPAARPFHAHAASPVIGHRRIGLLRRANRFPFLLPYGGLLYGAYDDPFGYGVPYGAGADLTPSPAMTALQALVYRPACRLESDTRPVPAEGGGRRFVTITRCVVPLVTTAPAPFNGANLSRRDLADDRPGVDVRGCLVETRIVPSMDGGGEHKISVTHC